MAISLFVPYSVREAETRITRRVLNDSVTGELIDSYSPVLPGGAECTVLVLEKHYSRAGNRLTLTATLTAEGGGTRAHLVSGGGGEGLFRFDWFASDSFESWVAKALTNG